MILYSGTLLCTRVPLLFRLFFPGAEGHEPDPAGHIRYPTRNRGISKNDFRSSGFPTRRNKPCVALQERRLQTELDRIETADALGAWLDRTEAHLKKLAVHAGIGSLTITRPTPGGRIGRNPHPILQSSGLVRPEPLRCFFRSVETGIRISDIHFRRFHKSFRRPSGNSGVESESRFPGPHQSRVPGSASTPAGETEADIDIDSTLLLGRVTEIPADAIDAPDPSGEWNRMRFIAPSPGSADEKK